MVIEIQELDAVYCKVLTPQGQGLVWEILSYEDVTRNIWSGFPEAVKRSHMDKRGMSFLCGLIPYVTKKLVEMGHEVDVFKIKVNLPYRLFVSLPDTIFEKYQSKLLRSVGKNNRGILIAPTGGGKSLILGGIISKYNIPVSLLIVPTKSILKQMENDFKKWFPEYDIGIVGDNQCTVGHITIALFQSLSRWDLTKYNSILQLIIIDECHKMNNSIQKMLKQLTKVPFRFGVTATPRRETDFNEYGRMIGNIGPIISEVDDIECISRVTPCHVYTIGYYCHSPKGTDYRSIYQKDILFSIIRNRKLLSAAKKLALDKGKTCVFLLDQIEQGEIIFDIAKSMGLNPYLVHSKMKKGHNENIKKLLSENKINLVIATGVWGIGTSIYNIDCVVLASARKSYIDTLQKLGRARRRSAKKEEAIIIDVIDKVRNNSGCRKKCYKYFEDYSKLRISWYKEKKWYMGDAFNAQANRMGWKGDKDE